jgi:Ser/Thr protein kinase RdoA (MazF antagonist)
MVSRPETDDFARWRIDDLERLLARESVVEGRSDLRKVVIHGDYAPWNLLMQPDGSLFVLDFNAARLDLRIYDIILATFWFAWRGDHLDLETAMELQTGYCAAVDSSAAAYDAIESPTETEIALASDVFCWVMGRAIVERLRTHYLEERFLLTDPTNLERMYQMCVWAQEHPQELTCGLRAAPARATKHSGRAEDI